MLTIIEEKLGGDMKRWKFINTGELLITAV